MGLVTEGVKLRESCHSSIFNSLATEAPFAHEADIKPEFSPTRPQTEELCSVIAGVLLARVIFDVVVPRMQAEHKIEFPVCLCYAEQPTVLENVDRLCE